MHYFITNWKILVMFFLKIKNKKVVIAFFLQKFSHALFIKGQNQKKNMHG
jgi:hypothetical protein